MTSVVSCQQEFPCLFYRQEIVTGQCPALLSRYRHIINTNYTSCYCQSSLISVRLSPLSFASVIETQIKHLHSSQKAVIMLLIFDTKRHIERDAAGRRTKRRSHLVSPRVQILLVYECYWFMAVWIGISSEAQLLKMNWCFLQIIAKWLPLVLTGWATSPLNKFSNVVIFALFTVSPYKKQSIKSCIFDNGRGRGWCK